MKSFKALLFCIMALCLTVQSCKTKEPTFEQVQELTYEEVRTKIESPNDDYKFELVSYEVYYKDYENSGALAYLGKLVVKSEALFGEHKIRENTRTVKITFKDKEYKTYDLYYFNH